MAHWKSFTEREYLFAFDLQGRDVHVQIESVTGGEVTGDGGRKSKKPKVRFRGKEKPLILNATNAKTITNIVGDPDVSKWIGQWITLYPTTTRSSTNEVVDCIRVRPRAPDPSKVRGPGGGAAPREESTNESSEPTADAGGRS